jgi:hypothetical protein
VEIAAEGPRVTEQGRYACRRFFAARGLDIDRYQLSMRATRTSPR